MSDLAPGPAAGSEIGQRGPAAGSEIGQRGPAAGHRGTWVEVDHHRVWYEEAGSGPTLLLLHGGLATNEDWAAQWSGLAPHRHLLAPERQAHGHTPDRPGPLTYEQMAADTIAFCRRLELDHVDLLGWSDGGMVGFLVADAEPGLVRTLVVTGAGFSSSGYVQGSMEALVAMDVNDERMAIFREPYAKVSPDGPAHFSTVWDKMRRLWSEPFDWSDKLAAIAAPVLVIVGDDDLITVRHAEEFARRVPNGELAVVPGASHLVPIERPAVFNQLVLEFTGNPKPETLMPVWRAGS